MKQEDLPKVPKAEFLRTYPHQIIPFINKSIVAELYDEWDAIKLINLHNIEADEALLSGMAGGILLAVLNERFLPKLLLHEFALRCAEWALPFVDGHYVNDVEAIRVKRLWLLGKATDEEYVAAREAANSTVVKIAMEYDASVAAVQAAIEAVDVRAKLDGSIERWVAETVKAKFHELDILRNLINEWEG